MKAKTVYAAMSADLLHQGHLNIIKKGAEYGELTLGVLSDKAISSYKRLPYQKFEIRKQIMESIKGEEEIKINKFKSKEEEFKNKEKQILAKKNLITKEEITKELKLLQINFQKYRKDKLKEVDELKVKRNKNIINFLNQINPIIEKYMEDNSITMLLDKKNIFIANKNSDITLILIELIDNKIKSIDIN